MSNKNRSVVWGVSGLSHDASLAVAIRYPYSLELCYASHAERYSRVKNDQQIHALQIEEAMEYGAPDYVCWFEDPLLKRLRYLRSGMIGEAFSRANNPEQMLRSLGVECPIHYGNHHRSHAAAAFYTRPISWRGPVDVLVADAIGEFDTLTCWTGQYEMKRLPSGMRYPQSLGLLYTAVTQYVGLKPNEEEFILMGMAAYGQVIPKLADHLEELLNRGANLHRSFSGCRHANLEMISSVSSEDLAATVQNVVEGVLTTLLTTLREQTGSRYLCLSGGVSLNCVANTKIAQQCGYDDLWILPNPGDAGSSLGAILAHEQQWLPFQSAFLGTNIQARSYDLDIIAEIYQRGIAGVARGRAEWGPRALGNRSLLADPRKLENKDLVNTVKHRQKFRPFAPICLIEDCEKYFELPGTVDRRSLNFMQYAVRCKRPEEIPAVVHADGTSRIQIIDRDHPLYLLLLMWRNLTGCSVLLNTSLNIKGEPLVNSRFDAQCFERQHGIRVFS